MKITNEIRRKHHKKGRNAVKQMLEDGDTTECIAWLQEAHYISLQNGIDLEDKGEDNRFCLASDPHGLQLVWKEILSLREKNKKHRKGKRMREMDMQYLMDHAFDEAKELHDEVLKGTRTGILEEAGDLIGILLHMVIQADWTEQELTESILTKFAARLSDV